MKIFLYGPPGSGKTTCGQRLAQSLDLPFTDLDEIIAARCGKPIPEIFASEGERGFRLREKQELERLCGGEAGVIALGGGALLDETSRARAESAGRIICLGAEPGVLAGRLAGAPGARPLLGEDLEGRLQALLAARRSHYASFPAQIETAGLDPEQVSWQIQVQVGRFRLRGMGNPYDLIIQNGSLDRLGELLQERGMQGTVALVSDEHVAPLYAGRARRALEAAGYPCSLIIVPPGEQHKTIETVIHLWGDFINGGLDRGSTVVALGGGVVTDLAGFAAGAYLRGLRWVAVPTSLLGMVDAGLGGKTGVDLPQGKNLAGLFHPPALVLSDPAVLKTLDPAELRNGLAEALKHGVVADAGLFNRCAAGLQALLAESTAGEGWEPLIRQASAVKVQVLLEDPYEQGRREALNFGHTIGHAVELASGFRLRHGEAVAIGMCVETRVAETAGVAAGLAGQIEAAVARLGLPQRIPAWVDRDSLRRALAVDKKRRSGRARLALPLRLGAVKPGFEFDEEELWSQCLSCMDPT